MEREQIIELFRLATKGERMPSYQMRVEEAINTTRFVTGEGHDEWVRRVRNNETKEEKDDRVSLYTPETPTAIEPIIAMYRRVYRVDGVQFLINSPNEDEIKELLSDFSANRDVFEYIAEAQPKFEFSDPNAYLIVGKTVKADGSLMCYPIEVAADEILNVGKTNGVTDWLLRGQKVGGMNLFTFYAAGIAVTATEYDPKKPIQEDPAASSVEVQVLENRSFLIQYYLETGTTEFPGIEWGAYRDLKNKDVKRSPIYPARHQLMDMVAIKSIADVSMRKHVFPKRYELVSDCTYEDNATGARCDGRGYLNAMYPDNMADLVTCPACAGKGTSSPRSENNVTQVRMPAYDDPNEIMPLSSLYHYESVELSTIQELNRKLDQLPGKVIRSIFANKPSDGVTEAATATEISYESEIVNNQIYPVAQRASAIFEKIARVVAQYAGYQYESISHHFPENLKLETLNELLARLRAAKDAGAPENAIFAIQCEITEKTNAGDVIEIANMKAFERHKPWKSLDAAMIASLLQERATDDVQRVLYENWDRVIEEVSEEVPEFSALTYSDQRRLLEVKAMQIVEQTKYATFSNPELPIANELE